ncbi:MAG: tetratricopeptide repeat protein [Planctomycetota bacterium]|jgi:tetratricopeptide (TPR) repeat protein
MNLRKTPALVIGIFLFWPVCLTVPAEAGLPKDELYKLFTQANQAFRRANSAVSDRERENLYEKAILVFEKIVNDGEIRNARLYYNLANAYFLKGNLGKAILNYRRAERLDEADADIRKNLSFARSRRLDKVRVRAERRVLQTLFFWHYDFSIRTKFVITCICFAILCISLTLMIWLGRNAPATVTAVVAALLAALLLVSVIVEAHEHSSRISGVITVEQIVAHQADWQDSPPSFKEPLHAGTEFDLIEHRPGWFHIRLADDSDGWIPDTAAELI